jgi:hypothetical protein
MRQPDPVSIVQAYGDALAECKLVSESSSHPRPKQPSVRPPLAPVAAQTARSALLASASPSSKGLADKVPPRVSSR